MRRRSDRIAALATFLLASCSPAEPDYFQGYAEGEYVRVAAPIAGDLTLLSVKRGDTVTAGAPLFSLEQQNEAAARREAADRVARAAAQLENLRKGKRPEELAVIRAEAAQAQASLRLSEANLRRQEKLVAAHFISREKLDEARAAYERDRARLTELAAQLETAKLAARQDEIRAAEAELAASKAALAQADWRLAQKSVAAPRTGLVADTLFVLGEWVPAGAPVVSLLPPENIKLRFFVPETWLGRVKIGQPVEARCDGCPTILANVSFVSPEAEFTPPVIYSRETRAKLVYLIEARTNAVDAPRLHPGQPVEVRLR